MVLCNFYMPGCRNPLISICFDSVLCIYCSSITCFVASVTRYFRCLIKLVFFCLCMNVTIVLLPWGDFTHFGYFSLV